jgi:hypothetical protein
MYLPDPREHDDFDLLEHLDLKKEMAEDMLPLLHELIQTRKVQASGERYEKLSRLQTVCEECAELYNVDLQSNDS